MPKDIKITNYTGDVNAILAATPDKNGSNAEKIAWYAMGLREGSEGQNNLYVNDLPIIPITTFTFTSTGTGAEAGTLSLFYPASEDGKVVQATGNVKLGAGGDQTSQVIVGNATNTFTVFCTTGTGTLVLPNTYTRFSSNTSDTDPTNGWNASTNAPSLAFDIATIPAGLITFRCTGSNTISGDLPNDWKEMTYFLCTASNTISGDLPNDWKEMTYFYCTASNTISGDLPNDWKEMTYFLCAGYNEIGGIREGAYEGSVTDAMRYLLLQSTSSLCGLSADEQEALLIGKAGRTWTGTVFNLSISVPGTAMASMADTAIPGRWFSDAATPTDVAIALKTLVKTKNVNVTLNGLTMPGDVSGDGSGFPVGFGDWWRS